jgi:CcmD family protein
MIRSRTAMTDRSATQPAMPAMLVRAARRRGRALPALLAFAALLARPALALAQEFQKVEGKLADEIPAVPFVGIAYGFIWIAVLGYVIYVARGLVRVQGEVAELRRKVDGATREADRK